MTFREVNRAIGEFHVEQSHEKELEKVILENFTTDDLAEFALDSFGSPEDFFGYPVPDDDWSDSQ